MYKPSLNESLQPIDWAAPPWAKALVTTRQGGISQPPYDHFNLADHVGDDPARVRENRSLLEKALDR